ncbi:DCN1-like protein 3 [Argopecten irradians]|uniref:DCN1-like protein 3 n=1 Tax=Argopecten irradians TaxID=31199 RepID=UPI003714067F
MGKCQSCCETPGNSASSRYSSTPQSVSTAGTYRGRAGSQPQVINSDPGGGDVLSHLTSSRQPQPMSDKKMFTPYPKLPPIKKHSNGDNKRLSFISRDYSESKIQALFEQYKEPGEDAILAEGIEKFCSDLDVNPDEFIVLVLAWKFQAKTMCKFTREEFVNGCKAIKADSIKGIQGRFTDILKEVKDKQKFKELYRWTYKFGLDAETGQRTLPIDMTISLWKLVFSQTEPPIVQRWLEFLEVHPNIRGIPRDTWDMFLNFTEQVGDDLGSYDDTEAWPSLFDDFVENENDRQNQNVKTL